MRTLFAILGLFVLATPAFAQPNEEAAAEERALEAAAFKRLGFVAQAGVPDGVTASVVYRPVSWVRTHLGMGYNLIGPGIQGGVALIPFGWGPSFTLEAGHFFDGNANGLARQVAGGSFEDSALLQRVGYDYANAHLGFELGRESFTFFIHGGMSYVATQINNVDAALQKATAGDTSGTELRISQPPTVHAFVPSLKLGFVVYLW